MTRVLRASPSAVEQFLTCPARWGYQKLPGGTPEPGNDATEFGTEVHTEHERRWSVSHFRRAVGLGPLEFPATRAGIVARAMAEHLPAVLPDDGYFEEDVEYVAEPGIVLHGLADLAWPDGSVAVTADYKTCGTFRYAKIERDALFGHAQAPLYLLMNMRRWGLDRARALWLYGQRPPIAMPPSGWPAVRVERSEHVIGLAEATDRVHLRMVPPAREMRAALASGMTAADAGTLPKNLRACRSYRKLCPYYYKCQPEKSQDMSEANAFLAGLNITPAAPAAAATAPVVPATQPTDAPGFTLDPTPPASGTATTERAPDTTAPPVNPPEAATKAGKGKGKGAVNANELRMTEAEIGALADAVVDRLALRLVRNVP